MPLCICSSVVFSIHRPLSFTTHVHRQSKETFKLHILRLMEEKTNAWKSPTKVHYSYRKQKAGVEKAIYSWACYKLNYENQFLTGGWILNSNSGIPSARQKHLEYGHKQSRRKAAAEPHHTLIGNIQQAYIVKFTLLTGLWWSLLPQTVAQQYLGGQ